MKKSIIKISTGNYPNGEKIKVCQECLKEIAFMEKALMSCMDREKWICVTCFEKKLGSQVKGKSIDEINAAVKELKIA